MTRSAHKPIKVLPPEARFVVVAEEEFEELTDLLADLLLERISGDRNKQVGPLESRDDERP